MAKILTIPAAGLVGMLALREATSEMNDTITIVREAIRKKVATKLGQTECWVDVVAVYPDRAVVQLAGRYHSYPFTIDEQNVATLGEPTEVSREFAPVAPMREAAFIEAAGGGDDDKPTRFLVRIIKSGRSKNNITYPAAVLREAAPLFDGQRVFLKSDQEHLKGDDKNLGKLVGVLHDARFVETSRGQGEIQAVFEVLDEQESIVVKMREAVKRGYANLFGLSIDCDGPAKKSSDGSLEALGFTKVHSVDLVVDPGAGGQIIKFTEAVASPTPNEDDTMLQRMLEAIRKANNGQLPAGLDQCNEDAVLVAYREAVAKETANPTQGVDLSKYVTKDDVNLIEVRASMREAVRGSGLPEKSQTRLIDQLEGDDKLTTEKFREAIKTEKQYLADLGLGGGQVAGLGNAAGNVNSGVWVGEAGATEMLDKFFAKDRSVQSFKEAYIEITGDKNVTGLTRNFRFREATIGNATFPVLLGAAMNRAMISLYNKIDARYDVWRDIVSSIVPLSDFRTRNVVMLGGFGDLPTVNEKAAYVDLGLPGEIDEDYAPAKRGGIVSVSLEAIKNDDVGFIQRIPMLATLAAKRTLNRFVLNMIKTPPTLNDGVALFHADHANLGTTAFSKANYLAARLAMMKQADPDTSEVLGLQPAIILYPVDLEETVYNAFQRGTNVDPDYAQSVTPKLRAVTDWTDANDWAMVCDPNEHPTIEIGFMDGQQEPELLLQDSPTAGSVFTNDMVTWKMRHIYGGTPVSHLGMRKHVVA